MVKRIFNFGLILIIGIGITFLACSDENILKNEQVVLSEDEIIEARQKSFENTVAKIKENYYQENEVETRADQVNVSAMLTCDESSDVNVNCVGATTFTITLPISGNNKIYHPSLPPFPCGYNVTMDIKFCQSAGSTNSVAIFSNFQYSFSSPISSACWSWLIAWSALPLNDRLAIRSQIEDDLQPQFEFDFMSLWASNPNNEFSPCPANNQPCGIADHAIKAQYYKASCSKTCYVYARDCEEYYGFLCIKDIPCYSDGCCKRETTYCLNSITQQVEVCHEAYYLQGECTTLLPNAPCVLQLAPCQSTPNCPKK